MNSLGSFNVYEDKDVLCYLGEDFLMQRIGDDDYFIISDAGGILCSINLNDFCAIAKDLIDRKVVEM